VDIKRSYSHALWHELVEHLPYALIAVATGLGLLSFFTVFAFDSMTPTMVNKAADILFHNFHFMHIAFAATGVMVTFLRFSRNLVKGLLVGMVTTVTFCLLSDVIVPYLGGNLLGVHMHFHFCFIDEIVNVAPFLFVGLLIGAVIGSSSHDHHSNHHDHHSVLFHTLHILTSTFASIFYLISHGFVAWYAHIGMVFLITLVAVVLPCTLSDLVAPIFFAGVKK
jgi:hypothetical protein